MYVLTVYRSVYVHIKGSFRAPEATKKQSGLSMTNNYCGHTKIGKPLYFQSESYGMGITWQGNLNLDSPGPVSRGCQDGTWLGEMKPGNKPESIKYLSRSAFKAPDKPKQGHT